MLKGYEIFHTDPGSEEEMFCRVCHSKCDVWRRPSAPTNFGSALARANIPHDVFTCPHAGREWHEHALRLLLAIEDMPSKTVADLMRKDLEELLEEQDLNSDQ